MADKPKPTVWAREREMHPDAQGGIADLRCEPCDFTGWTDTRHGVQNFYDEHGPHGVTPT